MKNYYIILGVLQTASFDEIKTAYRALAKKYHPDKNQGNRSAEETFKEIQEAYGVLSNAEKRRRYDLKLNYGSAGGSSSYTQQRRQAYTQYTGNAYQYAQQQAQYRQQQYQQPKPKAPSKPDKSENYSIFISVGVAIALLYLIISYTNQTEKEILQAPPVNESPQLPESTTAETTEEPAIHDFDSPYSSFFGEEVADQYSKNSLLIHNNGPAELVVLLVQNDSPHTAIRNQYMSPATTFKMNNIPDGDYSLKVYYGNNWDPAKTFSGAEVKGGFRDSGTFVEMNTKDNVFKMRQSKNGSSILFSSYEIELGNQQGDSQKKINAKDFFKK
jgi:curved DNA-binding protein CbpA